ncbi:MAG: hypothetical protein ABEH56_00955 [Salinirussus sp.]
MASEPAEDSPLTVDLPDDLASWLDDRAAAAGVDRETLLVQLIASYRRATELEREGELDEPVLTDGEVGEVEDLVEQTVDARLDDQFASEVDRRVQEHVQSALDERLPEAAEAMGERLGGRIDDLEREFQGKLEDVRKRVIQVKTETDAKAPADHGHDEFTRLNGVVNRVDELEAVVDDLHERVNATLSESQETVEEVEEELATVQDRLETVGWVVNDLREAQQSAGAREAVERIKRAAAAEDIDRARCESCEKGVELGLLTEPNCPHCNATVTDIEPSSGLFGKPKLVSASRLGTSDE